MTQLKNFGGKKLRFGLIGHLRAADCSSEISLTNFNETLLTRVSGVRWQISQFADHEFIKSH